MSSFPVLSSELTKAAVAAYNAAYPESDRTGRELMKSVWDYQVMLDEYMEKKGLTQVVIDTLRFEPFVEGLKNCGPPGVVPSGCVVSEALDIDETDVYVREGSKAEAEMKKELKKVGAEELEVVHRIMKAHPLDVWVWSYAGHDWDMMEDYDTESDDSSDEDYEGQLEEHEERINKLEDKLDRMEDMIAELMRAVSILRKNMPQPAPSHPKKKDGK